MKLRNWLIDFSHESDVQDEVVMLYTTQPSLSVSDAFKVYDFSDSDISSTFFTTFPSAPDLPYMESTLEKPVVVQPTENITLTQLSTSTPMLPSGVFEPSTLTPFSRFSTATVDSAPLSSRLPSLEPSAESPPEAWTTLPTSSMSATPTSRMVSSSSSTSTITGSGVSKMITSSGSSLLDLAATPVASSDSENLKNFRTQENDLTSYKEVNLAPLATYLPKNPTTTIPTFKPKDKVNNKINKKRKSRFNPQTHTKNFTTTAYALTVLPNSTLKPKMSNNNLTSPGYDLAVKDSYQSLYEIISR